MATNANRGKRVITRLSESTIGGLTEPGNYADGGGLYFRVSAFSTGAWWFRYTYAGRTRDMGLGGYPKVSLNRAREMRAEALKLLSESIDPIDHRQTARTSRATDPQGAEIGANPDSLGRSQLVESVAKTARITTALAEQILAIMIATITAAVASGDDATLRGFGTFTTTKRAPYIRRNPMPKVETTVVPASIPIFKAGQRFKTIYRFHALDSLSTLLRTNASVMTRRQPSLGLSVEGGG